MSSFYAGIMAGSGGGGSADYDNLKGAPIKNIGGTTGVTDLSVLETGHYALKGAYKVSTESSEEISNTSTLDVLVLNDTVTKRHIIEFITVDNGEVFFNVLTYEEDGSLVKQDKFSLSAQGNPSWDEF